MYLTRGILPALSIGFIAALATPLQAQAPKKADAVTAANDHLTRLASEQQAAAERDQALVNSVAREFYYRRAGKDGPVAIDASLEPLRKVFPDARLRYKSESDFCTVQRVLSSARVSAGNRLIEAIQLQNKAAARSALFNSLLINFNVRKLTGESFTEGDIERAFIRILQAEEPIEVKRGWSYVDYLGEEFSDDPCL